MKAHWSRSITGTAPLALAAAALLLASAPGPSSMLRLGAAGAALAGGALGVAEARRRTRDLQALEALAQRLSEAPDLRQAATTGAARAAQLLGAEAAALHLLGRRGRLVPTASWSAGGGESPDLLLLNAKSAVQRASATGEPAVLTGASGSQVVLAPLIAAGRVHGLLAASVPERVPVRDRAFLRLLGTQLGVAVAAARTRERLLAESRTDALTRLGSRRLFDDQYAREVARARRSLQPLALAMLDVDDFKAINDTWGHATGDRVLQALGGAIRDVRAGDVAARFGGDEFAILMPETTQAEAEAVAARIGRRVERLNAEGFFPFALSVSIGVRQLNPLEGSLLEASDARMYAEKQRRKQPLSPAA